MFQAKLDPQRIVTEAAPAPGTTVNDGGRSLERRAFFASGSGVELQYPDRLVWPSPWVGHIPFAFWLVEALRPGVVVELGVHSGNSYCAFLQAARSLSLAAQCYGVDHWRGDEHSDRYGDDVYAELCSYHDQRYGSFSTLIRATFEEALPYFSERSVDLLHIDGFHTYEAVAKDFSDWLPKMSSRGVVLFHDINVREREFGVWRFWEEITSRYQTLSFVHSHGLGLAYLGSEPPPVSLRTLLALSDPDAISRMRSYFARLGMSLIDRFARSEAEGIADASRGEATRATAQVTVLQDELAAAGAEVARQIEVAARLQQELSASRAETARQTEAASALQRECSEARSELARQEDAARIVQMNVRKAADRIALLEDELEAARAEIARQLEAADASRAASEEMTEQVAALVEELSRARGQMSEAIAQRERATQTLRQQITATARLQRESAALTERLDDLATDRAAEVERAADLALSNHEIRRELDRAQQELHRVHVSVADTLAQPRYVVADRCNDLLKKARFLHAPLKRVWAARHRGR